MPRMELEQHAPDVLAAFLRANKMIGAGPLDPICAVLAELRASQLNGCLYCVDMHSHDARALGVGDDRIFQLTAWRESLLYSPAERAALAYTEAATRLAGGIGVPDEVWDELTAVFTEAEIGYLVGVVALINAFNRICVPLRKLPAPRRQAA